jgi:glucan phosphoethanolaminetransferase (alkaline phosphatase superfamily)
MLQKFRPHLLLALIFTVLTLAQQYSFYGLKGLPIVWLTPGKYSGIFLFFLFFTFAKGKKLRFFLLSFVLILCFFQLSHLSYFGTQILPSEIYLLFSQFNEIGGTLKTEIYHVLIPLLLTLVPLAVGWWCNKKIKPTFEWRTVGILFALYFCYNPIRTFITGNTWGRQPSTRELVGMNVYLSTSYFLGRILPSKLMKKTNIVPNSSLQLDLKVVTPSSWDKIIVVLGESLSPHHMELFGYKKPTTPFLKQFKDDSHFFHTIGLSSGVSTDISVAFFLNLGFGSAGNIKSAKGQQCIFKLAKTQQFETHFISAQSSEQLRYIAPYVCNSSLDDYRSLEDISPQTVDHLAAIDRHLLPSLDKLLQLDSKQFILLHQRGSHAPWHLRFTPEAAVFKSDNKDDTRVADYDNSVYEFDLFWKEMHQLLIKSHQKILVIYLSDHGEELGETGQWGHGFLKTSSFEIPIIIQSFNQKLPEKTKDLPPFLPQYNLSLYIAQELGFSVNQPVFTPVQDYVIYGNDIDGFAGQAVIKFEPSHQYTYKVIP